MCIAVIILSQNSDKQFSQIWLKLLNIDNCAESYNEAQCRLVYYIHAYNRSYWTLSLWESYD